MTARVKWQKKKKVTSASWKSQTSMENWFQWSQSAGAPKSRSPVLPKRLPPQIVVHVTDLLFPLSHQGRPLPFQAQEVAALVVLHVQEEAVRLQGAWITQAIMDHSGNRGMGWAGPPFIPPWISEGRDNPPQTHLLDRDEGLPPLIPDLLLLCLLPGREEGVRAVGSIHTAVLEGRKARNSRHPRCGTSPRRRSSSAGC